MNAAVDRPQSIGGAFLEFNLAELQLLALGLWIIGDENRVDPELLIYWHGLRARIAFALQRKVIELMNS